MQNPNSTLIPKIVRAGEGQCLELRGEVRHQLLDAQDTAGAFSLARSRFQHGSGSPLHAHTREDEWFVVLGGEFEFLFGERTVCAQVGDIIFGPRLIPHAYTCASESGGELLIGIVGAGFEEFFRHLAMQQANGKTLDFPAIRAIGAIFGVQFANFDTLEATDCAPKLSNACDAECFEAFGGSLRPLISSEDSAQRFCLSEGETPSFGGPPLHVHKREDELFVILAGRYEFQIGDARVQVGVGDVVFAPRGIPHSHRVVSCEAGRTLSFATPGGFDDFFRECSRAEDPGEVIPPTLGTIAASHEIRLLLSEA